MLDWIETPLAWAREAFLGRRQVSLRVHRAFLVASRRDCYFVNLTNLSRNRDIEVTHIWFESHPPVHVLQRDRPLPKRLRPDETWETWLDVSLLPSAVRDDAFTLVRARLSTGKILRSERNVTVPTIGAVPGGPIHDA